jgi:diguanylate cyclase (GGDEF)-like protein/PAS domain S-box-containing protein
MTSWQERTASLDGMLCRALVEATVEGVVLFDRNGIVRMMNPSAERLFGYRAHEVIGQSIARLIPESLLRPSGPEFRSPVQSDLTRISGSGREVEGLRKNGKCFPMYLSLAEFSVGGERVIAGVAHDLTEQRQIDDQRRQAAAVFEHAAEGMMITDANGTIEAVNSAFADLTGYARDEVVGRNVAFLKSGRHKPSYYATIWQSIRETGAWRGEIWNRRKSGQIHAVWLSISALKDTHNELRHFLAVYADISPLKNNEQRFAYLAHHDPLTGLANRLLFSARFEQAVRRRPRRGGTLALLFLDLNRFKQVNDTLGHAAGDMLVADVAKRITAVVRPEDTVARLGGDEFAILLEQLSAPRDAAFVARKVLTVFSYPFRVDGQELGINVSIGISLFPRDGRSLDDLLRSADRAMYRAKQQAGNRLRIFEFASDLDAAESSLETEKPEESIQPGSVRHSVTRAPINPSMATEKKGGKGSRVAEAHERVLALVDKLLEASHGCSVKELAESLPELFDFLLMHFADEERRGGDFDLVRAKSNHRQDDIETLINQHFHILSEVADLVKLSRASFEDGQVVDDPFRLFLSAEHLVRGIKDHEQREEALFQEFSADELMATVRSPH